MPTLEASPYEIDRNQRRNDALQARARQRPNRDIRNEVEYAINLDGKAGRLERQVAAYDNDTDGFRQRVHTDRIDWNLRLVFWGTILAYVFLEFISCGDIAEFLAHQMAPQFATDLTTGDTPIWLRRLAGVGFVGGMVIATLLVKLITTWFRGVLGKARASVAPGDHLRYWSLTGAIAGIQLSKVAYVATVAVLYLWLFGFAKERAVIMADIASEQKQTNEWSDPGIKIESGTVETNKAIELKPAEVQKTSATTRLAGATGVFYAVIVLLHALVLLLPTKGFTRELELARFKRGKAETKAASMREDEGRTLREVYERIRTAPDGYQQDFIDAAVPVIPKINKLYGSAVIRMPEGGQNSPSDGADSDSGATPQAAAVSPRTPNSSSNGSTASLRQPPDNSEDNAPTDEVPPTNWDAIFPGAQHT